MLYYFYIHLVELYLRRIYWIILMLYGIKLKKHINIIFYIVILENRILLKYSIIKLKGENHWDKGRGPIRPRFGPLFLFSQIKTPYTAFDREFFAAHFSLIKIEKRFERSGDMGQILWWPNLTILNQCFYFGLVKPLSFSETFSAAIVTIWKTNQNCIVSHLNIFFLNHVSVNRIHFCHRMSLIFSSFWNVAWLSIKISLKIKRPQELSHIPIDSASFALQNALIIIVNTRWPPFEKWQILNYCD